MARVRLKLKSPAQIRKEMNPGLFKSLGQAGAFIRTVARRMVRRRKTASQPGTPPHTKHGALKNALLFSVEKRGGGRVVIGPSFRGVGRSMMAHEYGGQYKGGNYPKRALMGPALEKSINRIPRFWKSAIN